jgi:hypothetical protein
MGRWAEHIALTAPEKEALLQAAAQGDAALREWLYPISKRKYQTPDHVVMDRAWEPIHRCLTGDHSRAHEFDPDCGRPPLWWCIMGGRPLHREWVQTFWLVEPNEVAELASAVQTIDEAWFHTRFFSLPDDQFHEIKEDVFEWVWSCCRDLVPFFVRAAGCGLAVLCTIDH